MILGVGGLMGPLVVSRIKRKLTIDSDFLNFYIRMDVTLFSKGRRL